MATAKGKSLCISSSKGGVGKTFITSCLAGVFSSIGKKVLILDLDLSGGSIAAAFNSAFEKSIYNFIDDYNNNRYKDFNNYVTKYNENIYFVAAPKDPRQANKIDPSFIEILLDKAIHYADVVLIDTNHDLSEFNISILDHCDQILFIFTNDLFDLKNLRSLLAVFKDAKISNYKLLLNNSRDPFKKYFSAFDIKNILKDNVDYTISSELFLKNIDLYTIDGKIITLDPKMPSIFNRDYAIFMSIVSDFLEKGVEKK